MKKICQKILLEIEIFILSIAEISSQLATDILTLLLKSNKKYQLLIVALLYLIFNFCLIIYSIITQEMNKLFERKSSNLESVELLQHLNSFRFSVYIFFTAFVFFFLKEIYKIRKPLSDWVIRKKTGEKLDDLLKKFTNPTEKN
ncbi:hypothetical protein [Epilithonimonas sp.]|uniref:hypothetical protein n=1 Tax=Epilithonimonas sp. TaxID=2894511 RepID=UPI0028AC4C2C|nr:hypothetical protein [Epilithonimonas sp.]